jgi:hypothetical protein
LCRAWRVFVAATKFEYPELAQPRELRFDERISEEIVRSTNLERDLKKMWETVAHESGGKTVQVSPVSAINAASRVFATVDVIEKNTNEVFALLGHNTKSSDSYYNRRFFPVTSNQAAYCFENGNFGWQFTLSLDGSGRVTAVQRKWIR